MTKLIQIKTKTEQLLDNLRIGDESFNSIIYRNLKDKIPNKNLKIEKQIL